MLCCCAADEGGTGQVIEALPVAEDPAPERSAAAKSAEVAVEPTPAPSEDVGTVEQGQEAAELQRKKEAEEEAQRRKDAEAAARVQALQLDFRDPSGANYAVSFTTKPLGMDMDENVTPVKITKTFGAAKRLGVIVGSELVSIAGTDVQQIGYARIMTLLRVGIAPLAPDGLEALFRDARGEQKLIVFPTRPLGMSFDEGTTPIKITDVSDAASSIGVQIDWEIISIAGIDVQQMEFDKFLELLQSKISSLPARE